MIINKAILIIGLTVSFEINNAQTFIKYFVIDSLATEAYSIALSDSFIFVAGAMADTTVSNGIQSYLAKFDYQGNLISSVKIRPNQYFQFACPNTNSMIKTSDGGFAITGCAVDPSDTLHIAFVKYTSSGQLQFYKIYNIDTPNYYLNGFGIVQFNNKYYVTGEIQFTNDDVNIFLLKLDSIGNVEFSKTYSGFPQQYGYPGSVCLLPYSRLLISSGRTDNNYLNYWQEVDNTCFLVVDTDGNLIKQYCTDDSNTLAYYYVGATNDGNFLSSGSYYAYRIQGIDEAYKEYLIKWDTNFNKIWDIETGYIGYENNFASFAIDGENNIMLCGQDANDTNINSQCFASLSKVDANGNLVWFRRYMVPTSRNPDYSLNYLNDIHLISNGDIVAVGSWENTANGSSPLYFQEVGWMIRVDSNGCINGDSCGITTGIDEPPQTSNKQINSIQVFPNPSNGIFTVNALTPLPPATTIQVYDALGKRLLNQPVFYRANLINLYHLASGVYYYKIGNGVVSVDEGKIVIEK